MTSTVSSKDRMPSESVIINRGWNRVKLVAGTRSNGRSLQAWLCPNTGVCDKHGIRTTSRAVENVFSNQINDDTTSACPQVLNLCSMPPDLDEEVIGVTEGMTDSTSRKEAWGPPVAIETTENFSKRSENTHTDYTSVTAGSPTASNNSNSEKLPVLPNVLPDGTWRYWICIHEVPNDPWLSRKYVSFSTFP